MSFVTGWRGFPKWIQLIGAAILAKDYAAEVAICSGESMQPTLRDWGDAVLVEKLTPTFKAIQTGSIVIATSPTEPEKTICKRVAALEGEPIPGIAGSWGQRVPKGTVWLEGDNSARSFDSRQFGPVPIGLIKGRVLFKVWPLSEFGRSLPPRNPQSPLKTFISIL
jgi:mitochondrial inner membrane protease subunit 1